MKLHRNATTCPNSRALMARRVLREKWSLRSAAAAAGVGQGTTCVEVGQSMKRYVDDIVSHAPSAAKAAWARRQIQDPPVEVIAVRGDTATARITGVSGRPIRLERRDGAWKISAFTFHGQ